MREHLSHGMHIAYDRQVAQLGAAAHNAEQRNDERGHLICERGLPANEDLVSFAVVQLQTLQRQQMDMIVSEAHAAAAAKHQRVKRRACDAQWRASERVLTVIQACHVHGHDPGGVGFEDMRLLQTRRRQQRVERFTLDRAAEEHEFRQPRARAEQCLRCDQVEVTSPDIQDAQPRQLQVRCEEALRMPRAAAAEDAQRLS